MDAFAPPKTERPAGTIASSYVGVTASAWRRLAPPVRDAMAQLTRRPLAQLETQAAFEQPILVLRTLDPSLPQEAAALLDDLLEVPTETVGPLDLGSLLVFGGASLGCTVYFCVDGVGKWIDGETPSVFVALLGPLAFAWAVWTYAIAPHRQRAAAEVASLSAPEPLPDDAPATAERLAAERPVEAVGLLGAVIFAEPRGSPIRTAALRRAALLRAPDLVRANRLSRRADDEAGVTPAGHSTEAVPWQSDGLLILPLREDGGEWPAICPLCNQPGREKVRVYLSAGRERLPVVGVLVYSLLGFPFGLIAMWWFRRGVTLPMTVSFCERHLAARKRALIGAVVAASLFAIGVAVAVSSNPWGLAAGSAGCVAVFAATRFSPFTAQVLDDARVAVWGAHDDFVRDRPLVR